MNTGLAQGRVDLHSCKILEFCLDVDIVQRKFFVYYILEALDKDVGRDIEDNKSIGIPRKTKSGLSHRQPTASKSLIVTSSLQHLHGPGRHVQDLRLRKLLGEEGQPATIAGTLPYMSRKQRGIISSMDESYDACKSDVYSLGVTTLAFASATLIAKPWPLEGLTQQWRP